MLDGWGLDCGSRYRWNKSNHILRRKLILLLPGNAYLGSGHNPLYFCVFEMFHNKRSKRPQLWRNYLMTHILRKKINLQIIWRTSKNFNKKNKEFNHKKRVGARDMKIFHRRIWDINKHKKRHSTPSIVKGIQIKTPSRCHITPTRWAKT